ncbi:MAG TPA: hypothetical protein VLT33_26000, partial [Labilithrix sp.]|nr:hypothetical protein [Labilithrix sp.]
GAGADSGTLQETGPPSGDAAVAADSAPPCSKTVPFVDDFEGRAKLEGCWDRLTKSGPIAPSSVGELGMLGGAAGRAFRVHATAVDSGLGGAVYLAKTIAPAAPQPVRIRFKWLVEQHPNGPPDGISGLYAVEIGYQYKAGAFVQHATIKLAFGANQKTINPYLSGTDLPVLAIETGTLSESAIDVDATTATFSINGNPSATRTVPLAPGATDVAIESVKMGVTEVGSLPGDWSLYFDDVLIDRL